MGNYDSDTERSRKNKLKKRKHKRSYSRSSSSDSLSSSSTSRSSSCDRSSSSRYRSSKHSRSKKSHKHKQRSQSRHSRSCYSPSRRRRSRSPSEDKSSSRSHRHKSSSSSKRSSKHKKHKRRHRSSSSDSSRGRGDYSRGPSRDKASRGASREKSYSTGASRDNASRGASREKSYSRGASRDKDRSIKGERSSSIDKAVTAHGRGSTFPPPLTPVKEEAATGGKSAAFTELSESDKLKRERQIADIQESSFTAAAFKSSRGDKSRATAATCKAEGGTASDDFNFGTSAEMRSRAAKLLPIDDNSIFSPYLFGDPEEREEKYLKRVMSIRQRVYDNMTAAGAIC